MLHKSLQSREQYKLISWWLHPLVKHSCSIMCSTPSLGPFIYKGFSSSYIIAYNILEDKWLWCFVLMQQSLLNNKHLRIPPTIDYVCWVDIEQYLWRFNVNKLNAHIATTLHVHPYYPSILYQGKLATTTITRIALITCRER